MSGRIETYTHSDSQTSNKGAATVQVACQTDFAARTPEFTSFVKKIAIMAYAVSSKVSQVSDVAHISWDDIVDEYPHLEEEKAKLEDVIKEKVELKHAVILAVVPHWTIETSEEAA
jgi:translation elongation factor EF-Ts